MDHATDLDEVLAQDAPAEGYAGPAVVSGLETTDATAGIPVEVHLRGHFEPIDGRFHWFGRIAADAALEEHLRSGATVVLSTPAGHAEGRLSDIDPWGRFRITGTGRPPF